eukprot:517398_1
MSKDKEETDNSTETNTQNTSETDDFKRINTSCGPQDYVLRQKFKRYVIMMILIGASYDYFGKLIFQSFDTLTLNQTTQLTFWLTIYLNILSFGATIFPIFTKWQQIKALNGVIILKSVIPSFLDVFVTSGRILALSFLPASIVSIFKTSIQLIFLAIFRRILRNKKLDKSQWYGLLIVVIGVCIVIQEKIWYSSEHMSDLQLNISSLIGFTILFMVGLIGALRNTIEDVLMKHYQIDSDLLCGIEAVGSLSCTLIVAVFGFFFFNLKTNQIR